jgi:hypothetical protein
MSVFQMSNSALTIDLPSSALRDGERTLWAFKFAIAYRVRDIILVPGLAIERIAIGRHPKHPAYEYNREAEIQAGEYKKPRILDGEQLMIEVRNMSGDDMMTEGTITLEEAPIVRPTFASEEFASHVRETVERRDRDK